MKKIILLLLPLISFSVFSQIEKTATSTNNLQSISGFVLDDQYPLSGVNVLVKERQQIKKGSLPLKQRLMKLFNFLT